MKIFKIIFLIFFISNANAQDTLPGDSVYQVGGEWQNQEGEAFDLTDLIGKTQVLSMIYTNCEHVCPVIVSSMKTVQKAMPDADNVNYVLITFTPDVDTPEVMKAYSKQHDLSLDSWTLLRGDPGKIREMSMALGIRYEILANNEVNHSNLISVLDEQGRLDFQGSGAISQAGKVSDHILGQ